MLMRAAVGWIGLVVGVTGVAVIVVGVGTMSVIAFLTMITFAVRGVV